MGIASLVEDDVTYASSNQIASIFYSYFSSLAQSLNANIPASMDDPLEYLDSPQLNSFVISHVTEDEVCSVLSKMKNKKLQPPDIPTYIVKKLAPLVSPLIADIFNMSVVSGSFPNCLKFSTIVPIFKKSD